MRNLLVTIMLAISAALMAGVVDHDRMYEIYLSDNKILWGDELRKYSQAPNLTIEDKLDMCNYLYGYVATALEKEEKAAVEKWISLWESYLTDIESTDKHKSIALVYRSSIAAYKTMLYPGKSIKYGTMSLRLIDDALEADPNNPIAIGLRGNMKFYMPVLVGGNKREAARCFEQAIKLLSADCPKVYRWNLRGLELCLAEAYQKTSRLDEAINVAKQSVANNPDFAFMRDTFLPELLKEKQKD